MSTAGGHDLTSSNAGNSVISLISHTQWDVTLASFQLVKSFKEHLKVCVNAITNFFGSQKPQTAWNRRLL